MPRTDVQIRSLMVSTDIDVLPDGAVVADRGEYVVVRSAGNPNHYWGNFLVWREAPRPGDRARWEAAFAEEFADQPLSVHRAFTWDRTDGEAGAAEEFVAAGYDMFRSAALIARPHELVAHPRANDEVEIRALDPREGADEALWRAAVELHVANREPGHDEAEHRAFTTRRQDERRERFRAGDGAWFVAIAPGGEVAAACGIVVTHGRGRFQSVDTAEAWRRQGIATRLVHDVGRAGIERFGADHLVIGADTDYHAMGLYESLGFVARERGVELCWWPTAPNAALHPRFAASAQPAG